MRREQIEVGKWVMAHRCVRPKWGTPQVGWKVERESEDVPGSFVLVRRVKIGRSDEYKLVRRVVTPRGIHAYPGPQPSDDLPGQGLLEGVL